MNGDSSEGAAPDAALIPAGQPDRGGYGGTSLVFFPSRSGDALAALCMGTNGLAPNEDVLGRPGHARKAAAIARWINAQGKSTLAWAKRDPVRIDLPLPRQLRNGLDAWESAVEKYDKVPYVLLRPPKAGSGADEFFVAGLHALADLFADGSGLEPVGKAGEERERARSQWLSFAFPSADEAEIYELLRKRRFVVLEGPPGTGKTRAARGFLEKRFAGNGRTIQFHPTTSYETFIGGLARAGPGGRRARSALSAAPRAPVRGGRRGARETGCPLSAPRRRAQPRRPGQGPR
ncbi:MAG: AAA family ATPase [Myxococcaceae bacterium]|nr:AAA family ATPase [Myxococcaceae bacterium]